MSIRVYELVGADAARPFSPHCWKVVMALAHKGLSFERVPTSFGEIALVEGGASKLLPVLRDGDAIISDSFAIAVYLEEHYPDRPTLFGGPGGLAMARFIERWSQSTLHPYLGLAAVADIHDRLAPADQAYFRATREPRYDRTLEAVRESREDGLEAFRDSLRALRSTLTYQPFIGGETPLYRDYIVFGALQWVRITSPFKVLAGDDPVQDWFKRCLDLHDGLAGQIPAAA